MRVTDLICYGETQVGRQNSKTVGHANRPDASRQERLYRRGADSLWERGSFI